MSVVRYLVEEAARKPWLRRRLRRLREGEDPEAWRTLLAAPGAERLSLEALRALGVVVGHYRHAPGAHPARTLAARGPAGRRRLRVLLEAGSPMELARELARLSGYLGGALDLEAVEIALQGEDQRAWRSWAEALGEAKEAG